MPRYLCSVCALLQEHRWQEGLGCRERVDCWRISEGVMYVEWIVVVRSFVRSFLNLLACSFFGSTKERRKIEHENDSMNKDKTQK